MRELGYLPGELAEWRGDLLLRAHARDQLVALLATSRCGSRPRTSGAAPRRLREEGGGELVEQLRRMTLPPEALLLRRMEGLLFQIASTIRAAAPGAPLLRELVEGDEPVGELGAAHAEWLAGRRG